MRYHEIINEKLAIGSVDDVAFSDDIGDRSARWVANFTADGVDFTFDALKSGPDWYCEFRPVSAGRVGQLDWDKAYKNSNVHRNSAAVFVKLIGIMKHFLETKKPRGVHFSGAIEQDGHGRGTLYQKIARAFKSELDRLGYDSAFEHEDDQINVSIVAKQT